MESDSAVKELIKDMDIKLIKSKHRCPQKAKCEEEKKASNHTPNLPNPPTSSGPSHKDDNDFDTKLIDSWRLGTAIEDQAKAIGELSNLLQDVSVSMEKRTQLRRDVIKLATKIIDIDKERGNAFYKHKTSLEKPPSSDRSTVPAQFSPPRVTPTFSTNYMNPYGFAQATIPNVPHAYPQQMTYNQHPQPPYPAGNWLYNGQQGGQWNQPVQMSPTFRFDQQPILQHPQLSPMTNLLSTYNPHSYQH